MSQYRVLIDADDEKGLVYKVSSVFYQNDMNILTNSEFVDRDNNKFFMRSVVEGDIELESLKSSIKDILPNSANVEVIEPKKKNIIIMATKEMHALGDILIRHEAGELEANILAVISNYADLIDIVWPAQFRLSSIHVMISSDRLPLSVFLVILKMKCFI